MRLFFKKGAQKKLLNEFKRLKNFTWVTTANYLKITHECLKNWTKERYSLPNEIFEKIIVEYPNLSRFENYIVDRKDDNWRFVKGGINSGKVIRNKMKSDFVFRKKWVEKCRIGGTNNIRNGLIKNWEIGFRNVGRRRFIGPNNEKMFTEKEKEIAEFLEKNQISYKYEPKLVLNKNTYFPDFIIKNFIIERCGFSSKEYFSSLKRKLKDYSCLNKNIVLVAPKNIKMKLEEMTKTYTNFVLVEENEKLSNLKNFITEFVGSSYRYDN